MSTTRRALTRLGLVAVVGFASLSVGCVSAAAQRDAVRVRVLEPKPFVDLPTSSWKLALELAPEVPDAFEVPEQNGVTPVPVEGWRTSLTNGFKSGPARFFAPAVGNDADLKLVILRAELDFVPTTLLARGGAVLGAASVVARIRYMARLVRASGDVVGRAQGEVASTQQWSGAGGSSTTSRAASEAL
jgi:hypothetical protein